MINAGDTAWMLVCTALVFLMTPGLALFYGGLVRKKNVLSIIMQCFASICLITLQWVTIGYSLAFGPDQGGLIGSLEWFGLQGVGAAPSETYATTIPHIVFCAFQLMFAIITPAIILGAFAERMRFSAYCVFIVLWATFVYDPVCHWVWGGGFLGADGTLDFAGGTVIHINAGVAALAAALVLGRRREYPHFMSPPHNLPFVVLGAAMLWFGWFGFNAGSALQANGLAGHALMMTQIATAAAGLVWGLMDIRHTGRATTLGLVTGAVAGLVAITPAAGFVDCWGAIGIGGTSSVICFLAVVYLKNRFGYDDSLDAFGVHGLGGIWGALATGLWATTAVNADGADGAFFGNPSLLAIQAHGVVITTIYAFIATVALLKIVDVLIGLRVNDEDERIGLDLSQHSESAYTLLE